MSDVTDALDDLAAGRATLPQVAEMFASRSWPQMATDGSDSFPPPPEGSFAEVATAYSAGVITSEQYQVLAEAAARAMGG